MAGRINVSPWPTTSDCIAWSDDNWLALASTDQVVIITPRLKEAGPNGTFWDTTFITVNAFTADEVPRLNPLSFRNFSIGEELSNRHVYALAWSSPRLAKFGRCALAVLSANHVLSLWECDERPTTPSNWKRKVVINHAIRGFYGEPDDGSPEREEKHQVSQRIRSFCWSTPVCETSSSAQGMSDHLPYIDNPTQWLAVSTEGGHILLLSVQPPTPESRKWKIETVSAFDTRRLALGALEPSVSDNSEEYAMKRDVAVADHIAWGSWSETAGGNQSRSRLTFICKGRLFTTEVLANADDGAFKVCFANSDSNSEQPIMSSADVTGPLRFACRTNYLICVGTDTVFCIDTSSESSSNIITSHHLDDRWDEVTGLGVYATGSKGLQLNVVSHLSTATAPTSTLSLPLKSDEKSELSQWLKAAIAYRDRCASEHGWRYPAQERTWGLAVSPLGDCIATVISVLASDAVAYVIPSEQQTVVEISETDACDDQTILPIQSDHLPPEVWSSEVILFRLRSYLRKHTDSVTAEKLAEVVLGAIDLLKDNSYFQAGGHIDEMPDHPTNIRQYLRMKAYMHPTMRKSRFQALASVALNDPQAASRCRKQTIQNFVHDICTLPQKYHRGGKLSHDILSVFRMVHQKLNSSSGEESHETCDICQEAVPFESVNWAMCRTGHRSTRCGLTFLSIQGPARSKYCTICDTEYLDEWKMPALRELAPLSEDVSMEDAADTQIVTENGAADASYSEQSDIEPSKSLARLMFTAFDVCIYCGGRYTA